ncbi:YadA-like family protein [Actinobacillus equuli subsp. equuli]|uniref:YadA-like family protein n=1 Tax=Actinobacillus equuli TaxID=718 RepID=UPI002442FE64|nr:YadA-like family protein [Actinobacillus equuli]WGE55091.1 YadA-like family protein [Actinobacillus equuli subsp. equuli]
MNKIFKVIWNHATQSFVVVSELSRNKGKVSSISNEASSLSVSSLAFGLTSATILGSSLLVIPNTVEAAISISGTGSNSVITAGATASGVSVAIGSNAQATGDNTIALGGASVARGLESTALGYGSESSGGGSVAIGKYATAGKTTNAVNAKGADLFTIAIGAYANATQNGAIAIGGHSQKNLASHAEGNNAIALGVNANATGAKATSIGSDSKAIGERALSLGDHTATNARYAMSIGAYASSTAENATSIGSLASASGQRAIAMGTNVSSSGYSAIAIGGDNLHNTVNVDVAGSKIADYTITQNQLTQAPKTQASATGSTAIGVNSVASAILSTVIGPLSTASGRGATAIGLGANATKDAAVVLGVNSTASGLQSVVVGTASIASNESSVVLGSKSRSTGFQSVAVGVAANASGYTALAFGDQANSSSNHSTAIGFMANAHNYEATAIGTAALASGIASFAAGSDANATANFAIAIGQNSNAKQENTIAIGSKADANGIDALAMGTGTKATEQSALALGPHANANIQNSVALGSSSITITGVDTNTATVNGLTYSGFAGNRVHSVVSVGSDTQKRQIQNVAAGQISTTSTDAINGSQLYATQQVVGNVANSVKTVLGGNAALATTGAISTNNIGNTGKDTVHDAIAAVKENVVAGKNTEVTPAIATNGSTTYTVDAWNTTVTNGSAEVSVTSTTDNNNKVLAYTVDLSQATKNNITTANTTAHNANATANAANATANTALTEVKKGWNITTKANGGNVANNSTEQVSMGELVTFEAGKNINLTQNGANITIATSDKPTFNTVTTQNFNVQNGGKVDMGGNRITNVGTPTEANDAATKQYVDSGRTKVTSNDKSVTIKQSKVDGADVYDLTVNADLNYTGDTGEGTNKLSEKVKFAGTADEIVTEAKNGEVKFKLADKVTKDIKTNADNIAKGFGVQAEDNKSVTKQLGDVVPVVGANSNIKTLVEDNKVKIALNNTLNLTDAGSVKLGDTTVNKDGVTITGGPSVTKNGIDAGNKNITNVSDGVAPNDAVNVGQLNKVNATANAGWKLTVNKQDANVSTVKPNATVSLNNEDGNILITKSADNNNVTFALNSTMSVGGLGKNGQPGKDGVISAKGADGQSGVTLNGKDGSIGLTGPAGQDGKPGASTNISVANGKPGVDGKDGGSKTRIVYDTKDENGNPVKEEVATLNDGLKFGANDVTEGVRKAKLNEQVDVKGATTNSDWKKFDEGQNVMTKVIDGNITIAIAKDLQGLNSITFTNGGTGKDVVLNGNGLNNGGNKITNVSDGVDPNDAVNVSQLNKVNATANAGWNIAANGNNQTNVKPNANVSLNNEDGNILITKSADNNNVTFALNSTLSVGGLGKDGQPGKDGVIGAKGADGKTGVTLNGKDGSIGINGKDGSNGTITLAKGKPGVNGKDGDTKTRITYQPVDEKGNPKGDPEHVATLNDGLKFVGDVGDVIKKELNDTLTIKGNLSKGAEVTDKNLRVDNVNGALILKMAKSLQELTNATFVDNAGNRSVIDGNGLTITPKADSGKAPVSLTDKGLNNGGNQVTNVSSGLVDNKGQKVDLANATGDVLNNAVNVGDLKNSINNLTNATTGGFGLTGDDGKSAKADLGKTVTVQGDGSVVTKVVKGKDGKDALQVGLSNDVTIGNGKEPGKVTVKGENGKDGVVLNGKDGSAEFKNADGKTTVAINGKDGTIGLNGKDGVATKVDGNGVTITGGANGTVNLTDKGLNNGGNTITNVAAGVNATDAVNVSQLKDATAAATSKVEAGKNTVVTPTKNADGSTTYTVATKDEVDFTKVATGNTTMTNEGVKIGDLISLTENGLNNGGKTATNIADGDISATSKDAVNGSQLHATNQNVTNLQNTVAKGWNIEADTVDGSTGKVIGKSKAKVAMGDTVAVKAGNNIEITQEGKNIAIATSANPNFDSVKIGKGSNTAIISTTEDGAINVANANGGPTRITNVAAGKKDNDAVNVAQLKGAMSNINNNINAVNNKVDKVDRDLRAGIAGAMAAGNLYHVTIPGKSMVSAGIGTYKNQGAVAVGYSRLSDNGKIGVKFSVNTNTRGDSGAAASVGYQW